MIDDPTRISVDSVRVFGNFQILSESVDLRRKSVEIKAQKFVYFHSLNDDAIFVFSFAVENPDIVYAVKKSFEIGLFEGQSSVGITPSASADLGPANGNLCRYPAAEIYGKSDVRHGIFFHSFRIGKVNSVYLHRDEKFDLSSVRHERKDMFARGQSF